MKPRTLFKIQFYVIYHENVSNTPEINPKIYATDVFPTYGIAHSTLSTNTPNLVENCNKISSNIKALLDTHDIIIKNMNTDMMYSLNQ